MKSLFLLALALAPSIAVSDASLTASNIENRHAEIFTDLVREYCVKHWETPEILEATLKEQGFNKSEDYDDTFVKYIDYVDYAVTPDNEVCTTDVLLKPANTMLFELTQVEKFLISVLKLSMTKSAIGYELSSEDKRTKVVKRDYIDEQGKKYSLIFPLENQGEYYMTFDVYWNRDDAANKVD